MSPEDVEHREDLLSTLRIFGEDPGTGFSLVDGNGTIVYTNSRAAHLFTRASPDDAIGRSLTEVFGERWAAERHRIFDRIRETGMPVISRHIRHGVQLQSTIRLLGEPDDGGETFLILTVEGEHEPLDGEDFEIRESDLVHLGPLGSLTKRELEVLALIGHGLSTPVIAKVLFRSPRTIERHCDSIRQKLNGASRVQMAEFAQRAGLRLEDSERTRI